jgi:hypothetical protein
MRCWAALYEALNDAEDNRVHKVLIEKKGSLLSEDFELAGRWKEGCLSEANLRWKSNTPTAYDVWMQAKKELPMCPTQDRVAEFLNAWSEIKFSAGVEKKTGRAVEKRFGMSRATALLHFVSGGLYPIFDSRVAEAMNRLGSPVGKTIDGYLTSFCRLFGEIAELCGASGPEGLRMLDNALFCYGKQTIPISMIDSGCK